VNYKDAMEMEFKDQGIHYEREKKFTVRYKEKILRNPYIADYLVYDEIILEIKSASMIIDWLFICFRKETCIGN
jgi:GxxExxY protein